MNLLAVIGVLLATTVAEKPAGKDAGQVFFTLPVCQRIQVGAEVLKPGATSWTSAEEGRFYPLGSAFRAASGGSLTVALGKGATATVEDGSSFGTRPQGLGIKARTIVLLNGELQLALPGDLGPGLCSVTSGSLTVVNPAGKSKYVTKETGDGIDLTVRCVTGSLEVKGRHFTIPAMHAADEFRVRSSRDDLETILYGKSGDYVVRLDRGLMAVDEIEDDGSLKQVSKAETLDWHLSVSTRVQINRAVPAVGERLSVTMMTFDAAGTMKNHFAFAEGRGEVNTGELIVEAEDSDAAAKNAAAATTDAAAADVEDESVEDDSAGSASDDEESSSDDASDSSGDDDDF